ncbi:hypothetical protein [Bradyrhizobium sp. CCBAU 53415]|uniref:hypothetical protein n=1 Tax=Bradyrhizobium sp. CCBAU 53415 TaxID=1325119 RepID=UPI00230532ED|nr:hypothetical protein [Bradyrhizobium sp. CCBAU 53415]MDA9463189.1 hypothetical protein [Bradyrhizobium sp. CCBAU 53415]
MAVLVFVRVSSLGATLRRRDGLARRAECLDGRRRLVKILVQGIQGLNGSLEALPGEGSIGELVIFGDNLTEQLVDTLL